MGFQVLWQLVVSLAKGRMLQHLAKPVAVSLGGIDGVERLCIQQAIVLCIEIDLIDHATGDDEVVAIFKGDVAHQCPQGTSAFVDKKHFVCIGIFVKVLCHGLARGSESDVNVVVDHHGLAAVQIVILRRQIKADEFARRQVFGLGDFGGYIF